MKKILFGSVLSVFLATSINAYELDGKLAVKWTGFKTEKKAPVSGTFKNIDLNIKSSKDIAEFLKSAKVTIETSSFDSKNPFRDNNIVSTLFSLSSAKYIKGKISSVNSTKNSLVLDVTMNEVTRKIPMTYTTSEGKIVAKGGIEILDFDMKNSFLAFAKKCAAFHQNKSHSNVNIEFTLPYK